MATVAEIRSAAFAEIHDQPSYRTYTVAEVKRIVYPLIELIDEQASANVGGPTENESTTPRKGETP